MLWQQWSDSIVNSNSELQLLCWLSMLLQLSSLDYSQILSLWSLLYVAMNTETWRTPAVLFSWELCPCHLRGVQGLLPLAVCNYWSVTQPLLLTGTCLLLDKLPCWFRFYAKCMDAQCLRGCLESLLIPPNSAYLMHCLNKLLNADSCFLNPLRVSWLDICENLANPLSSIVILLKILDGAFIS